MKSQKKIQRTKIPPFEHELILAHILNKSREWVLTHPEVKLTRSQARSYRLYVARRQKGEPLAYILGHKGFYGLDFIVNKNVLVPRPETELIIDYVTHNIKHETSDNIVIIDIGTGSGCIIITLAKLLNRKSQIAPARTLQAGGNRKFIATDISKPALFVARKNAKQHGVDKQIKFLHGNLLEPALSEIKKNKLEIGNWKLEILCNLPYLTPAQIKNSPSIKHEPRLALAAGRDGLKYYRELFKQIKSLRVTRYALRVLCEIDPRQKQKITALAKKFFPRSRLQIKKDLRGHSRLLVINLSPDNNVDCRLVIKSVVPLDSIAVRR
ncbi:MAG: peptide chain release factor N(5)-glutamine methyltransferase [Patescibacteria group bacterium]|jgi:release factor glutamine methyltransferase